jgi:DMSO/TMAO reductase YedYZ molybdopterin-dependent catalytic subunit
MMKLRQFMIGAFIGLALTASLLAVMFAGNQLVGLPFVPFDLFNWMTPLLPGPVITFGIERMLDFLLLLGFDVATTAKLAEQTLSVVQFLVLGVVVAIVFDIVLTVRRTRPDWMNGLIMGAIFGLPLIAISLGVEQAVDNPAVALLWLILLFALWGMAFSYAYARLGVEAPARAARGSAASVQRLDRRRFTITFGAAAAVITVVGAGLGSVLARREAEATTEALNESTAHQVDETAHMIFPNQNDPVTPVSGTRPEYTPVKDHYKVFLELEPTVIDGSTWRLPVTGMVDNALMLSMDDLRNNFAAQSQYVTLSCISGKVGTTLISTTQWTGVSAQELLAAAKVQPAAKYLRITSGDGYYETVPLDLINADKRIMFCYDWDGNTLPVDHGFPLRIWIPDRFGMKQPKWITAIEVTNEDKKGYWVERGWDEIAQVKTTSVIDTIAVDDIIQDGDTQRVPIGGIAWAGARGIGSVEVSADNGPWQQAQLRAPLSETTWVIWRYEWPFQAGAHTLTVRCTEKDDTPQITEVHPAHPAGATGLHQKEVTL